MVCLSVKFKRDVDSLPDIADGVLRVESGLAQGRLTLILLLVFLQCHEIASERVLETFLEASGLSSCGKHAQDVFFMTGIA